MTETQITQADREAAWPYRPSCYKVDDYTNWMAGKYDLTAAIIKGFAAHRANHKDATPVAEAWAGMEAAMQDPDYAWGWHCNLAVPIMDATGITHEQANMAAAHLMQHLWKCDITTHPHYQYEKSDAQSYAELRIDADKAEDASSPDHTEEPLAMVPATDVAALVEADLDWRVVARLAGEHGIRYRTNKALVQFLAALAPFTKGQP